MKSERRHELQENILASYLGQFNRAIEPYLKPLAVVLAVLVAGVVGYSLYSSKQSGDRSDATLNLILNAESQDADDLASVISRYPGTPAADWAYLHQGSTLLAQGTRSLYLNRLDAEDQLNSAISSFSNALAGGSDPLLKSRAHFGLARVHESLGNIDDAISEYEACIRVGESKEMAEACQERIDALSKPDATEFLAWFADQDFSPTDPAMPPSLPSGATLPDLPDLDLPDLMKDMTASEGDKELNESMNLPEEPSATEDSPTEESSTEEEADAGSDQPAAADQQPMTETQPEPEQAETEQPKSDQEAATETSSDEPAADEPSAVEPAADEPSSDPQPAADEPAMTKETPASDEPVAEDKPDSPEPVDSPEPSEPEPSEPEPSDGEESDRS